MTHKAITLDSGKFNEYLHHIDLKEFGTSKILSSFIAEFDDFSLFLDSGSSLEVNHALRYAKKNRIHLSSVKYLITTHHHFDHCGGMWKLYNEIKKYNPNVKILTNNKTKDLLNDYEYHLNRAKRTFGKFIGEMRPIEDEGFKIIKPSTNFNNGLKSFDIIDKFNINGLEIKLAILNTPGHTFDHQCPIFIKNDDIDFIFFGEAVGTLYHSSKLITLPTSMPIYFRYKDYMETIENLKKIKPSTAGFGHFGVVHGRDNVRNLLLDNESIMKEFRSDIIKYYQEKPETKYVVKKVFQKMVLRTDLYSGDKHPILQNIILGITYGMMMDLGYRKE